MSAAVAMEASQEARKLAAMSQLRQAQDSVAQRTKLKLWGRLPTEGMLKLRGLPDKTVRVYSALVSLLQGAVRQIAVAEIAFLALLEDRQTRRHLQKLRESGLIDWKGSLAGPNYYWLLTDCAGPGDCQERKNPRTQSKRPKQSGHPTRPDKDQKLEIKPKTQNKGEGKNSSKDKNQKRKAEEVPPIPSLEPTYQATLAKEGGVSSSLRSHPTSKKQGSNKDKSVVDPLDYLKDREKHQKNMKKYKEMCEQLEKKRKAEQTKNAQKKAVEQAVKQGILPSWWVALLEKLTLSKVSQSILIEAAPRERSKNSIKIGLPKFFASLAKNRRNDFNLALSRFFDREISVLIAGDKSTSEISVGDIQAAIQEPQIDFCRIRELALSHLGWESVPDVESIEAIDRYGKHAIQVIELAQAIEGKEALELLQKWLGYPIKAVLRLVELEKEKFMANKKIRNYRAWWKPTLRGIVESQNEQTKRFAA